MNVNSRLMLNGYLMKAYGFGDLFIQFGSQGGSRPAHHVAEHFNGKEEVRTQSTHNFFRFL